MRIVNFFDFDPLKNHESLHLPETIVTLELTIWQQTQPCSVNHKPGVKNEDEIEEYEGERVSMTNEGDFLLMRVSWKVC